MTFYLELHLLVNVGCLLFVPGAPGMQLPTPKPPGVKIMDGVGFPNHNVPSQITCKLACDLLPGQCRVQRRGQRWLCPQSHHYDETPSHPSRPPATSCKPGSTLSPIQSDSLSAAGSCTPSYRWPPVLSWDWSQSDRHCNDK